jgi:hypothetical protein
MVSEKSAPSVAVRSVEGPSGAKMAFGGAEEGPDRNRRAGLDEGKGCRHQNGNLSSIMYSLNAFKRKSPSPAVRLAWNELLRSESVGSSCSIVRRRDGFWLSREARMPVEAFRSHRVQLSIPCVTLRCVGVEAP